MNIVTIDFALNCTGIVAARFVNCKAGTIWFEAFQAAAWFMPVSNITQNLKAFESELFRPENNYEFHEM